MMKLAGILIPVVCLGLASEVLAQEENRALILAPSEDSAPVELSPRVALGLSFLGSAIPMGVGFLIAENSEDTTPGVLTFAVGSTLGPSLGHFYAGRPGRAWLGIGVRLAAMGATLWAVNDGLMETESHGQEAVVVIGFLTYCASGIIDIATAPGSVAKANEESRFLFQGTRIRTTGDPALALQYRF